MPPGGPERDLSEVAVQEPEPKTENSRHKAKTKHVEPMMQISYVLPRSSTHRWNEDARHGVQSEELKQISAGRPLRQWELPVDVEGDHPSLGKKHPEEELEDNEGSKRKRQAKVTQYHDTAAPREDMSGKVSPKSHLKPQGDTCSPLSTLAPTGAARRPAPRRVQAKHKSRGLSPRRSQ